MGLKWGQITRLISYRSGFWGWRLRYLHKNLCVSRGQSMILDLWGGIQELLMRAFLCALMRKPVRKGSASTLLMGPAALPYGGVPCPVCGTQCCVSGLSPGVTLRDQQEPVGYRRVGFSTKTRNSRVLPATRISKGIYGSVLRKHSLALRSSPALGLGWGGEGGARARTIKFWLVRARAQILTINKI